MPKFELKREEVKNGKRRVKPCPKCICCEEGYRPEDFYVLMAGANKGICLNCYERVVRITSRKPGLSKTSIIGIKGINEILISGDVVVVRYPLAFDGKEFKEIFSEETVELSKFSYLLFPESEVEITTADKDTILAYLQTLIGAN